MLAIGTTVSAEPAPKPSAVSPAARPRPTGEPLERVADGAAVDDARTDTADCSPNVQKEDRIRDRVDRPCNGNQNAADADHHTRTVLIDQVTLERNEPSLCKNEDGEGDLDRGFAPMIFLIDGIDEQRPAVLQIGNHHHADDAGRQLAPPGALRGYGRRFDCRSACGHLSLPGRRRSYWPIGPFFSSR